MKIAVTYDNESIFQHFGHTEQFKVYEIKDKEIIDSQIIHTMGSGHGALATFLSLNKIDGLICGGLGGGAQNALNSVGIFLYGGVSGSCDDAVRAYIDGTLAYNPDVKCNHHDHGHEHSCSGHSCGNHSCENN